MYGYGGYGGYSVQGGGEEGESFHDAVEGSAPIDTFDPFDELEVSTVEQLLSDPSGAAADNLHVEDDVAPGPCSIHQLNTGKRVAHASASSEINESDPPAKDAKATRKRAPHGEG